MAPVCDTARMTAAAILTRWRLVAGFLLVAGTPAVAQAAARPNVVMIVTDDQGWADIGYHNPKVYSPRLDALAAKSVRFTQHYVMPQCTPTRVALLTGRYPSRFGPNALEASNAPALPAGTRTLATLLQAAGYATFLCGKWHLGSEAANGPAAFGFDHSYGSLAGACGMYDHRYRPGEHAETWHRDGKLIAGSENGEHATDLVAREAVRIVESKPERPFFLMLAFHAVHTPLDERGRFVGRPTQLDPKRPGRWLDEDEIEWFHDPAGKIQAQPDPQKRLLLAAVHHLDHAVGSVVDALDRTGQRDNTLILFTSDNGPQVKWPGGAYPDDLKLENFNQPLPMRGSKTDVWEGGVHVPGFAHWPARFTPRDEATPVHVVDWLPTLAGLCGGTAATTPPSDGVDLVGLLAEQRALPDRDLYWVWSRAATRWALRHGDWKIVRNRKGPATAAAEWQLFHLGRDPRETTDVSQQHPDVLAAMHARFLVHRAKDAR